MFLYEVLAWVCAFMTGHCHPVNRLGSSFSFSESTLALQKSQKNVPLFPLLLLSSPPTDVCDLFTVRGG